MPGKEKKQSGIPCYDPSTMQHLGYAKAMTPQEVIAVLSIGQRMPNEAYMPAERSFRVLRCKPR